MNRPLAAALAAMFVLAPAGARASTAQPAEPVRASFDTQLSSPHEGGAYVGRLDLVLYPSGIIQGRYRTDEGRYAAVTGGLRGDRVWLAFGLASHNTTMNGTYRNGVIHASSFDFGGKETDLTATLRNA